MKTAVKLAAEKGLQVVWGEDGYMKTKFYTTGFEYFPRYDRNLFYGATADHGMWFDRWPSMAEKPYMTSFEGTNDTERPLALTFGDNSEMTRKDDASHDLDIVNS